jgi:SAM-dependent methyltransferase
MDIQKSSDPKGFTDFEHEGWETVSAGYERHFARLTRQTVPATLDAAGVGAGTRVLDVCTGPGVLAAAAQERGADTVGLDFSAEAVAIARGKVPGAEFHQGDAQALPFEEGSFDAVVCGYGVIHVPNPEKALAEITRVLRPGGRAAISVWDMPRADTGFGVVYGVMKAHGDLTVPLPHGPDLFQFSTPESMAAALQAVGLGEVAVTPVPQTWEMDHPLGLVSALLEGSVRTRALLLAQDDTARKAIDAAIGKGMAQFKTSDGRYAVSMPALVGAGTK